MGVVHQDLCDGGIGGVEGDRVNGGPLLCHGNGPCLWWMTLLWHAKAMVVYQTLSSSSSSSASLGSDPKQ